MQQRWSVTHRDKTIKHQRTDMYKFYHLFANTIEIFANTHGYGVFDNYKGGELLTGIHKHFLPYTKKLREEHGCHFYFIRIRTQFLSVK